MTSTIEPVPDRIDQQQLAQQLVEAARADGVELVGPGGLLSGLTKTVLETALEAEMTEHLGYERHDSTGRDGGTSSVLLDGTSPAPRGANQEAQSEAEARPHHQEQLEAQEIGPGYLDRGSGLLRRCERIARVSHGGLLLPAMAPKSLNLNLKL